MLPNALLNKVPRPEFHEAFARYGEGLVRQWIISRKDVLGQREYEEFLAQVPQPDETPSLFNLLASIAYGIEKPDAFQYATLIKDRLGWPVDGALVGIFISIIEWVNRRFMRQMTTEWMMKNKIRFDKKEGDKAVFIDMHGIERSGVVKSVDRVVATGVIASGGINYTVVAEKVTA